MRRVAISQSNYIPWIGYFELINSVDTFILFENVQFTNRDWRNRNRIKSPQGAQWLTIPVVHKHRTLIRDVTISSVDWNRDHREVIRRNYSRAKAFQEIYPHIGDLYNSLSNIKFLSEVNECILRDLCSLFGVQTEIVAARWDLDLNLNPNEKILQICNDFSATKYITGPKALSYLDFGQFSNSKIEIEVFQYSKFEYQQQWSEFIPNLSIIDVLLNVGLSETRRKIQGYA